LKKEIDSGQTLGFKGTNNKHKKHNQEGHLGITTTIND
jgi:hypothetical protein